MTVRPRPSAASAARRLLACMACICLVAVPPTARADGPYRIGAGDVLSITVYGHQDLSGRYTVGGDGTISYPLLGEIAVGDLSRTEIEQKVIQRLAEQIPVAEGLSIEIAEYAPVFIIGDVMKPGRYEFRPGMIALELLAVGGGLERARLDQTGDPVLQVINLEQELYDLRLQRFAQAARRARLEAEVAGVEFGGDIAPSDDQPLASAQRARLLENERTLFEVRASVLANRRKALKQQHDSYGQEIRALTEGLQLHGQELALINKELRSAEGLAGKGLMTESRVIALQRELTATRRNGLEQQSFLARARQNQLAVALQIEELGNTRANDLALELRDLDIAIARAEERLATLGSSLVELRTRGSSRPTARAESIRYQIVRQVDGRYVTVTIGDRDPLKPRDILQVNRQPAEAPAGAAAGVDGPSMGGAVPVAAEVETAG